MDPSADYKAFWVWLRQQGKDLYNGTELGFTEDDLTKWFDLWKGARDRKAAPPPTSSTRPTPATSPSSSWSPARRPPRSCGPTRCRSCRRTPRTSSASSPTRVTRARSGRRRVDVLVGVQGQHAQGRRRRRDQLPVNDPEAGKILGTDRGLPSNLDVRKAVAATVTDPNMKTVDRVRDRPATKFGQAPQVPPKGHATVAGRAASRPRRSPVRTARLRPRRPTAFVAAATAALIK